jgi:hypothetical protein
MVSVKNMSYHWYYVHNIHINPNSSERVCMFISPETYQIGRFYFEKNGLLNGYDNINNSIINEAIFNNKGSVIVTYNEIIHKIDLRDMTIKNLSDSCCMGIKILDDYYLGYTLGDSIIYRKYIKDKINNNSYYLRAKYLEYLNDYIELAKKSLSDSNITRTIDSYDDID